MAELEFSVAWEASDLPDPRERATFASLIINAGPDHAPITEVLDSLAHTVRDSIRIPLYLLARWMVVNWWRLRWEPRPERLSLDWLQAHSLATVSSNYAWPAVVFSSDGDFIRIDGRAEPIADVAMIRYLRAVDVRVPVVDFEKAVEGLVNLVDARLQSLVPEERELAELVLELREEQSNPNLATECRLQAMAGFDPGAADPRWVATAVKLAIAAGPTTGYDVIAVSSDLKGNLAGAEQAIAAMRASPSTVMLERLIEDSQPDSRELPWQRGRRLAALARAELGIDAGPVSDSKLEDLVRAKLPFDASVGLTERALLGGVRNGINGRTAVLVPSSRLRNQRFYFSRLLGASIVATDADHVLPITVKRTAFQKLQRSFAQEFLCPWHELDAFTDEHGVDSEAIVATADHFGVSEYLILTTLVNNHKISRRRLPDDLV